MPKKKTTEPAEETTAVTEPVAETTLPKHAHTYYVWKDDTFVKYFTNEQYKGEAQMYAQKLTDEIGGIVSI